MRAAHPKSHRTEVCPANCGTDPGPEPWRLDGVERLLETAGMGFLGLRESLEPVGDFVEALFARGARHARIHVGVFVRLTGDRGAKVFLGVTNRQAGRRVTDGLEEFEV